MDSFTFFSAFAALLSVGRIIVHGIGCVHDNVSSLMPCNNNKTIDLNDSSEIKLFEMSMTINTDIKRFPSGKIGFNVSP
jgi:hypothetical protein